MSAAPTERRRLKMGMSRRVFLQLTSGALATLFLPGATTATRPPPSYGVVPRFLQGASKVGTHEAQIAKLGIKVAREGYSWNTIETRQGVETYTANQTKLIDNLRASGIQLIMRIGGSSSSGMPTFYGTDSIGLHRAQTAAQRKALAEHAYRMVKKWGTKVKYYEVWNEWDEGIRAEYAAAGRTQAEADEMASQGYVNLMSVVYPRMKQAASEIGHQITVIGPGYTGWGALERGYLEKACQVGLLDYVDAISYHCYNHTWSSSRTAESMVTWIDRSNAIVRSYSAGGVSYPQYITELGRPGNTQSSQFTLTEQCRWLTRVALLALKRPWVRAMCYFERRDSPQGTYGLRFSDDTPKKAWHAYKVLNTQLSGFNFDASVTGLLGQDPIKDHVLRLKNSSGRIKYALWTTGASHTISLSSRGNATSTDMMGNTATLTASNGVVKVMCSQSPKYVLVP